MTRAEDTCCCKRPNCPGLRRTIAHMHLAQATSTNSLRRPRLFSPAASACRSIAGGKGWRWATSRTQSSTPDPGRHALASVMNREVANAVEQDHVGFGRRGHFVGAIARRYKAQRSRRVVHFPEVLDADPAEMPSARQASASTKPRAAASMPMAGGSLAHRVRPSAGQRQQEISVLERKLEQGMHRALRRPPPAQTPAFGVLARTAHLAREPPSAAADQQQAERNAVPHQQVDQQVVAAWSACSRAAGWSSAAACCARQPGSSRSRTMAAVTIASRSLANDPAATRRGEPVTSCPGLHSKSRSFSGGQSPALPRRKGDSAASDSRAAE